MDLKKSNNEREINRLMDGWVKAVQAKDTNGIMAYYAPDILLFDLSPPLQYRGADAYKKTGRSGYPHFKVGLATRFAT